MALSFCRSTFLSQFNLSKNARFIQSVTSLVDVKFDESKGYAVVSMNNPPVNSLNLEMIQHILEALAGLERRKCKGFILTSSSPTVFCAGLDIREMYKPKDDRLKTFWTSLQSLWMQLYGSKMASVALINGHSPAGGCLLAMTCDFRVMVDGKHKIGLNETKLGIVAPFWFKDTMLNTIGQRQTEMALQLGTLFSVQEAHQIGLIDKVVSDIQTATIFAETQLQEFLKIPSIARYLSKMVVREATLKRLAENRESDLKQFVDFASSPQVQGSLGMYLENLKKKA